MGLLSRMTFLSEKQSWLRERLWKLRILMENRMRADKQDSKQKAVCEIQFNGRAR